MEKLATESKQVNYNPKVFTALIFFNSTRLPSNIFIYFCKEPIHVKINWTGGIVWTHQSIIGNRLSHYFIRVFRGINRIPSDNLLYQLLKMFIIFIRFLNGFSCHSTIQVLRDWSHCLFLVRQFPNK